MKIKMNEKAAELKELVGNVIDAMAATIQAETVERVARDRVPLSAELLHTLERYLRTECEACTGCGVVMDVDKLDLGRCASCDAAQALAARQ